jgi:multidrug resistance protein
VRRAPVFVVFLTVFIDLLGFGMVVPLLSRYGEDYGATPFTAGLLVASYSIAQFLFAPMWGHVSDRIGRKPVLATTLAGNVVAYTMFALAGGLPMLFVSRSLSGFFAANISTAQAYVADVTGPEDRAKGMGLIGMAFGLGFVLGPALGGPLAEHVGTWAPGAAAACLSAVACAVATFRLPESLPEEHRRTASTRGAHPILELGRALSNRSIAGILLLFFLLVFGFANLESMLALFLHDRYGLDRAQSGFTFVYVGLVLAFAQGFLLGRLAKRLGEPRLLVGAMVLLALGMQAVWLAPSLPVLFAILPAVALGMGLSNPTVATILSKRTPPNAQGRTLGLSQSLGALARAVSPGIAGLLYDRFGPNPTFAWGGAAVFLGLLVGLRAVLRAPESTRAPPEAGP